MQCENSRALRGSKLKAHVCEFSSQSSDSREETASHYFTISIEREREKKFEANHECIDAGLANVSLTSGNSFVRVHVLFSIKQRFLFAHSSRVVLQLRLVTAVLLWKMGVFVFVAYLYSWSGVRVIYRNWDIGGIINGFERSESGAVGNSM